MNNRPLAAVPNGNINIDSNFSINIYNLIIYYLVAALSCF